MTRKLRDDPMPCPSGYTIDFYCKYTVDLRHDDKTWGVTIGGVSRSDTMRAARNLGWVMHRDRTATCPACASSIRAAAEAQP